MAARPPFHLSTFLLDVAVQWRVSIEVVVNVCVCVCVCVCDPSLTTYFFTAVKASDVQ
jgi:hypothetical protein